MQVGIFLCWLAIGNLAAFPCAGNDSNEEDTPEGDDSDSNSSGEDLLRAVDRAARDAVIQRSEDLFHGGFSPSPSRSGTDATPGPVPRPMHSLRV